MSDLLTGNAGVEAGDLLHEVRCKLLVLSKLIGSLVENVEYEFGVELIVAEIIHDLDKTMRLLE